MRDVGQTGPGTEASHDAVSEEPQQVPLQAKSLKCDEYVCHCLQSLVVLCVRNRA